MIPRYSRPEMTAVWSPETRFRIWFEIEAYAAEAMAEIGVIPKAAAKSIREKGDKARFDVARIDEIEKVTRHDVIAFLTHLAEFIGPEARFVHLGLTSSDVLDTCLAVQLRRASDILIADVDALLAASSVAPSSIKRRRRLVDRMESTPSRRPSASSSPSLMPSLRALAPGLSRRARRSRPAPFPAPSALSPTSIRGSKPIGGQADLKPEPISTQVIPRDRHAAFFATLGVVASSVERLATEIRHLQRTEVMEAEEFFAEGQKGSSAMPHKRNPVLTENLTGSPAWCARR